MNRKINDTILPSIVLVTLLSIFTTNFAQSQERHQAIEYVYPDQSAYTTKTKPTGEIDNPLVYLAEALFNKLDVEWTAKSYPANRMFERLESGQANFSMLVRASRLKENCIFSKSPIVSTELRVYRTAGSSPITNIEDLKGKNIITIRGYSYGTIGKYLKDSANDIRTFEAILHKSAFEMLANGRAEYLLDYTGPSEEMLEEIPIPGVSNHILKKIGVFFVLSKSYPNANQMMAAMESAVDSIDVTQWGLSKP